MNATVGQKAVCNESFTVLPTPTLLTAQRGSALPSLQDHLFKVR